MLTLSTDGFKPKRIARREIRPLYLRVDDLETRQANNFMNTVLSGTIYSSRRPAENLFSALFSRLQIELHSLEENPIAIEYEGEVWRVSVTLFRGVADMAWFFDHAMQEELEQYGSTYQWSSAPFESHHRRLQIKVNQSTTASSSVVIHKFLLAKKLRLQVAEQSEGSSAMRELSSLIENTYKTRFPVEVYVSDDLYIPKYSEITEIREEDRGYLRLRPGDIPYSRIVVEGTVYSSNIYWKRGSSSQQNMVSLRGVSNGQPFEAFGSVIMFLYNSASNTVKNKDEGTRKKKESIVDLSRFIDKKIRVKFQGGREASGILKGYDALLNLVLDNCVEYLRDPENPGTVGDDTRSLGLIVARGTAITVVAPSDGMEQIDNPFAQQDE
ncbi:hypothetical protein Q1695_006377 [Nippostrongylus brasiliensis]|nr:hypothetical protein Q1695_006377 [Nippostrongylus brasiliensis]